jgi:FAD synthase
LLDFIRPEKKFDNITELKNAITDNAVTAKEIFDEMYRYGV